MNKLTIIGNVTRDPEVRTAPSGKVVCNFTVAANRRKKVPGQPEADFFRVSAWEQKADLCAKYITKGKKVCVIGSVSVHPFTTAKGEAAANMEVLADEIEFLTSRQEQPQIDEQTGFQKVEPDGLPY